MNTDAIRANSMTPWRPLFWEPVAGTGERLMVGVLHYYGGRWAADRIIRDDVLDALYGNASGDVRNLLAHVFKLYVSIAEAGNGIAPTEAALSGVFPGPVRETKAESANDLLRTAALLYSSVANIDRFDENDIVDAPQPEEINRWFSTEVRDLVIQQNPLLAGGFGKSGQLIEGGSFVRFGYFSHKAILHFCVLHPVRQSASVRDARARLWELSRASAVTGIAKAALITAAPRHDDPSLGDKQRRQVSENIDEIEREADAAKIFLHTVHSATEGAAKVLELVG